MTWADLDVAYLARQVALASSIGVLPLLVFVVASPRRRQLIPAALLVVAGLSVAGSWTCAATSLDLWHEASPYAAPVRIGPSPFALLDLAPFYVVFVWAPLGLVLASMWWWHQLRSLAVSLAFCAFTGLWGGFWQTGVLVAFEHSHEDTIWAARFSTLGWWRVSEGMSRQEVETLIGPPLPAHLQPQFLPGAEFWVRNGSAGYFGCLAFQNERVVEKRWWYSD